MRVSITPSEISGSVTLPASKSVAHRAMIAAFLSGGRTELTGRICGGDVNATIGILGALGADISLTDSGLSIDCSRVNESLFSEKRDINGDLCDIKELNACESGSTLRFMLPVLCALNGSFKLTGEGRLPSRPIKSLADSLRANGAVIEGDCLPLIVRGGLKGGAFEAEGRISSQFVTGILLALPIAGGGSVRAPGLASASYVDITADVLNAFGVGVKRDAELFIVGKDEKYHTPGKFFVEGDWSSAGFFAVAAAISGRVAMRGLMLNSRQGDGIVTDILKKAGAEVCVLGDGIIVEGPKSGRLEAFCYDAENCPDTVPIMCVAAAYANGISKITGVDRLKLKESDRLFSCADMLSRFGVKSRYENDALYITGGSPKGAGVPAYNDHRMAMSAAIAALAADGGSVIENAECVNKSYPGFFEDLKSLGAGAEIIG